MKVFRITVLLLVLSCMATIVKAEGYLEGMQKHLGVNISVSQASLEETAPYELSFIFGDKKHFLGAPVFEGGAILRLSEDYTIVMMDLMTLEQHGNAYAYNPEYFPIVTSWMLKLCGTHWLKWYIEGDGGVINDGHKPLSEKEREETKKKIRQLRKKYEMQINDDSLLEKTNSSMIYVTRLPEPEKILCLNQKYDAYFKSHTKKCYGIEFYKEGRRDAVRMLVFANNSKSVKKILSNIASCIRFN